MITTAILTILQSTTQIAIIAAEMIYLLDFVDTASRRYMFVFMIYFKLSKKTKKINHDSMLCNAIINAHCEVRGIISSWIEIHSDF